MKNKDVSGTVKPEETAAAAASATHDEKRAPLKSIRVDDVSASIFARQYNGRTFYSVSFTRSYKSASGEWRYTKNFDVEDLGRVVTVAQQAAEYVHDLQSAEPHAQAVQ